MMVNDDLDSLSQLFQSRNVNGKSGRSKPAGNQSTNLDEMLYGSRDSSVIDIKMEQIHLFGEAFVKFQDYDVKADYILFDYGINEVSASYGYEGFRGVLKPSFKSGEQTVEARKLRYNFNTNKGIVFDARVRQDQMWVHGATTKFVRKGSDSLHIDDVIYNRNALITTCDHEHPHWGIRTSKLKLIPEKLAVIGPARMELSGIPTPLFLPFAFAPLFDFNAASSGLVFPQDPFYSDPNLGIGIRGLGYYFALNDKIDLSINGDVYTRGSWALRATSNYYKRYKFRGNFNLGFSRQLLETEGILGTRKQDSYSFSLSHNQDAKAHPYRTIGGSLRFTVNDFDRRNVADADAQINSQINSNFSYAYQISNKLSFSSSITHSQNTLNRQINFSIPDVQLRLVRVSPFDNPNTSGTNEKWFEKIGLQYTGRFQNTVSTLDTLLFRKETLESFRAGATHEVEISSSYNLLKFFSFNTNINYDEFWYLQTRQREYEFVSNDTINAIDVIKNGFSPFRDLQIGAGVNTSLYGTISSTKGWFRGFRHTARPSLTLSYSPATDRYEKEFDDDPFDPFNDPTVYNPFASSGDARLFKTTSLDRGGLSMNYNLQNTFEAKYYSKKDSTEKKLKLFNNINLSGNYNFNADSLNWSTMSLSGSARLFKNFTTLSINGQFDPYVKENNQRINRTVWEDRKRLFRLDRFSVNISTQFTLDNFRNLFRSEEKQREAQRNKSKETELYSLFEKFNISHILLFDIRENSEGKNEFQVQTHSIRLTSGLIPITEKWGLTINNLSYDLKRKSLVVPSFSVTRDLHCWEMRFSWFPQSDIYSFYIGVKTSPFSDFIKYQTGRDVFGSSFR